MFSPFPAVPVTESANNSSTSNPYLALTQQLRLAGLSQGPAEVHGTVYGVLCARAAPQPGDDLVAILLQGDDSDDLDRATLGRLVLMLQDQANDVLTGESFEIKLLLPLDNHGLEERVQALADWCRGFLFGLVAGGINEITNLPGDAGEAIRDLLSISEAEPDGDDESGERALFELTEFVRVAVQLVFEELHPAAGKRAP